MQLIELTKFKRSIRSGFMMLAVFSRLAMAGDAGIAIATGGPVTLPPQEGKTTSIDVGRQLFVDDYLVGQTTLKRSFHKPRLYDKNPILKPETPVELNNGRLPVAAPFKDGAWYDAKDRTFKLWYMCGWNEGICYAQSGDGLKWERPNLDVVPGTNRVLPERKENDKVLMRDGVTVWLDDTARDPSERYKMSVWSRYQGDPGDGPNHIFTSPDGIHWKDVSVPRRKVGNVTYGYTGGDNSSFYYDPFRKLWVASIRERTILLGLLRNGGIKPGEKLRSEDSAQARFYYANADWFKFFSERTREEVMPRSLDRNPPWLRADELDFTPGGTEAGISDFTANAYESVMVGMFCILDHISVKGGPKIVGPKPWNVSVGYSRDGYHWERPDRSAFLASSRVPGSWNRGYIHPVNSVGLVVGDQLYFYFGAWSGEAPKGPAGYAGGSTGVAMLRRDGFASMDAESTSGELTTTPISFKGKYPFVNVDSKTGELRMEVLDDHGKVIAPYTLANSVSVKADNTHQMMIWKNSADLSKLAGKPVRFRFHLTNGKLYSFWVSPDVSGASRGYVAAGGPGFTGPTDTVGSDRR